MSDNPSRPCESCGELSPTDAEYDVAVHDCGKGEWQLITFTQKGLEAIEEARREENRR